MKTSDIRQFADDGLLYRHISNEKDSLDFKPTSLPLKTGKQNVRCISIQKKCSLIRVVCTNKRLRKINSYRLHGHVLDPVICSEYLGVSISEELTWKKHVDNTASKASRTLRCLHRNLRDCQKEARSAAYSAMVLLTLDYASTSWDPHAYQR